MSIDYINRADLLAAYDAEHVGCPGRARELIAEAPSLDVRPVVRGQWKETEMSGLDGDIAWVCSACGEPWTLIAGTPAENNMNFCPNCGAAMDNERNG